MYHDGKIWHLMLRRFNSSYATSRRQRPKPAMAAMGILQFFGYWVYNNIQFPWLGNRSVGSLPAWLAQPLRQVGGGGICVRELQARDWAIARNSCTRRPGGGARKLRFLRFVTCRFPKSKAPTPTPQTLLDMCLGAYILACSVQPLR